MQEESLKCGFRVGGAWGQPESVLKDASLDFFFWMAGFFVLGSPSTVSVEG